MHPWKSVAYLHGYRENNFHVGSKRNRAHVVEPWKTMYNVPVIYPTNQYKTRGRRHLPPWLRCFLRLQRRQGHPLWRRHFYRTLFSASYNREPFPLLHQSIMNGHGWSWSMVMVMVILIMVIINHPPENLSSSHGHDMIMMISHTAHLLLSDDCPMTIPLRPILTLYHLWRHSVCKYCTRTSH